MKLVSFRIKNYKSIKDSGECFAEEKITIFAGKNGSGKSNILEALHKFSTKNFKFEEDNFNYEEAKPIIENKFRLSTKEIKEIKESFKVDIGQEIIIKLDTNVGLEYEVEMPIDIIKIKHDNEEIIRQIDVEDIVADTSIEKILKNISDNEKSKLKQVLLENGVIDIEKLLSSIEKYIIEIMPKYVYKKTIENELKSVITKSTIKNNDFHKDIANLLGITDNDFDTRVDKSQRSRRGRKLSTELTGNFGEFYTQSKIELQFSPDGDSITMDVVEPEKASNQDNKIENKSDGLKWFIAFYVKLQVTKSENIIILLDEPGMYLHAKACSEMLKIFDDIAKESQIFLATHNPYLIKANNIGAVRLVLNETEDATVIENKPHKYEQDKNMDTLTPILTSIGYELTMSIHVGDQEKNLITEGITDCYYLQGMAKVLNKELDYLIIPSLSADKINYIGSILIGWGLKAVALLDTDGKGKKREKDLTPLLDKCVGVSSEDNMSIEDLFSKDDYCLKILELDAVAETANSKTKKDSGIDEVLKAKQFSQKVENEEIKLSKETKANFEMLFTRIDEAFNSIKK